jgi:molybdopterin converting factor small subunit
MMEIKVSVRYYNVLAVYTGVKCAELTFPLGTTISELLDYLVRNNPDDFRRAIGNKDVQASMLRVFQNEQLISGEDFDKPINDHDDFMLVPAISGG